MTTGFGEALRERSMARVRDEVGAFFGAYGEAATGAIHEGDFDALERSTDEFGAALKQAIPRWLAGETVAKGATARATEQTHTEKTRRSGAMTSEATFTKGDVRGTADALAKQAYPELAAKNPAAARAKVYEGNPDLVRLHEQAGPEPAATPEVPLSKGADVLAEANREARELMKTDPERFRGKSVDAVRGQEVWKIRPDLRARYEEALRS